MEIRRVSGEGDEDCGSAHMRTAMVNTSEPVYEYTSLPAELLTKLNCTWCLWYTNSSTKTVETFAQKLVPIGTFATAEAFWAIYSHCVRPSQLPKGTDFFLFRAGITPQWEDPANSNGCTLMLRIKKGYLNYFWELLILAVIGEQIGPEVNGCIASKRMKDDHLSIWNASMDKDTRVKLAPRFLAALALPENTPLDFKSHAASLAGPLQK